MSMRLGVPGWDKYFIQIAEVVKLRSKDPNTQIGCVIVDQDHQILATGYNDLPRGSLNLAGRFRSPEKYDWMVHAEQNAIFAAARRGITVNGATLYMSSVYPPCVKCAHAIVQAGIIRVVAPEPDLSKDGFKFDLALDALHEGGVVVDHSPFSNGKE